MIIYDDNFNDNDIMIIALSAFIWQWYVMVQESATEFVVPAFMQAVRPPLIWPRAPVRAQGPPPPQFGPRAPFVPPRVRPQRASSGSSPPASPPPSCITLETFNVASCVTQQRFMHFIPTPGLGRPYRPPSQWSIVWGNYCYLFCILASQLGETTAILFFGLLIKLC